MKDLSPGDPEGRRLARRRALLLSEAGQVARVLEVLLKRAEYDADSVNELIEDLALKEKVNLQKSHGHIEPRTRFKPHVGHPLLEKRPRSMLHVDENGKSQPEPHAQTRPTVFALGAVAVPEEAVDDYRVVANDIKLEFFGTTDFTFHEPQMRYRRGPYYFKGDVRKQEEFDLAINQLVKETNFVAFGVSVRKEAFAEEFVEAGKDPYLPTDVYALAIIMLLERYVDFLAASSMKRFGRVTFESIGPLEDAYHQLEYARVLLEGSQWVQSGSFRSWLETGLRFTPKTGSDPMELADMLSRDLYEWVVGNCNVTPKRWELFSEKIYCRGDGQMGKFGIKVFPDSDIRDYIEAHRLRYGANKK